jgi:hypothetical protein
MAWEYLEQKTKRYEDATHLLGELKGDIVLDFNSGHSKFKDYLKGDFTYKCNDLYDKRAMFNITDKAFLEQERECDVLCCFGIGGYEITGEKLESSTITSTLKNAIMKFNPNIIILESIQDFELIQHDIMTWYEEDYENLYFKYEGPTWLDKRCMNIWIKK